MTLIPFHDYALVVLLRQFPPIATRRELLRFMGGNAEANLLWTNYIAWHCELKPARRAMAFRAWMKKLQRTDCTYSEWCFISDLQHDSDFPGRGNPRLDIMMNYLVRIGANDSTLDSLESLWIKYNFAD